MVSKRGKLVSHSYRLNARGQVTVFIIVGILVLFTFAGILFVSKVVTKEPLFTAGDPVISEVPSTFRPIQRYTENCLAQVGKQGLVILGQQGGYINPEVLGTYSSSNPTEGDGLNFENTLIPYWHYNVEANDNDKVTKVSLQPIVKSDEDPTFSLEAQLARFAEEEIVNCLNDYSPFTQQGFIIENEEPKVEVGVTSENVRFLLEMDVDAEKDNAETSMERFFIKIPLRLQYYYDIADRITEAEEDHQFLEKQGMELLSIYSQKDINYFPPISDITYELFSVLSWNEHTLKEKYQELLTSYIPMLRFLGSSNFYYSTFPDGNLLAQKVSDNMVLPLTGADDLEISFDYFGWEPYFKTNSEDGVIKPENIFINYNVLTFGQQRYETHYDISYPVMVTVNDPTAFGGEGYQFVFTLESNIRNNEPAVSGVRESYPRQLSPIVCNDEQRNSALLKTVVIDSFTKEPIDLVKIGFSIPEQTDCEIGLTNELGSIESNYPTVYGGVVNFVKEDYLTNFYPIDTYKNRESSALLGYAIAELDEAERVIELDRVVTKKVRVKKKELEKCVTTLECEYTVGAWTILLPIPYEDISCEVGKQQCLFNEGNNLFLGEPAIRVVANGSLTQFNDYYLMNGLKDLSDNEEAVLTLERVSGFHDEVLSEQFTTVISTTGTEVAEVELVPGKYRVSGIVTVNDNLLIPEEQRCFHYDILGYGAEECFTMDESRMDNYISSNMQWDLPETYVEITPEDLYTSEEITFHVITQDLASVPEKITGTAKKCGGTLCLPGVGCAFDACEAEDVTLSGRVIEDLQVVGKIAELSQQPEVRRALEPVYR